MDIFKESTKKGLLYNSPKGNITTEQLWGLKLVELDQVAVSLDEQLEKSEKKSFIKKKTSTDEVIDLQLKVVVDVIETKQADELSKKTELDKKVHNEKIMTLIQQKQENKLNDLSVEELQAMLK